MSESSAISRVALKEITPDVSAAMGSLHAAAVSAAQDAKLEPELLELVRIRASQINGCAFCLDMHTKDARAQGETEQRIYALNAWRETPFFSARERAALALTVAVTLVADTQVPDAVYDEARQQFSDKEVVDLAYAIFAINAWNRLAITFRMQPLVAKASKAADLRQSKCIFNL